MKTTKIQKSNSSNSHSSKPFFNKGGEGSFFSQTKESEQPFFIPDPFQTKLTVGQPNDIYEQEADTMAEKVVGQIETSKPKPLVQAKCENCKEKEKFDEQEEEGDLIMRKPIFGRRGDLPYDQIQTKNYSPNIQLSKDIETNLKSSKGKGRPMPKETQTEMESGFGVNFKDVRIHTHQNAVKLNQDLQANAFAHGENIYFNEGQYDTQTKGGKRLLAHELTHVVQQQKSAAPDIMGDFRETSSGDTLFVATDIARGGQAQFEAAPIIINPAGDRIPIPRIRAEVTNRPFDVFMGLRVIEGTVRNDFRINLMQDPNDRNLRRWNSRTDVFPIPSFSTFLAIAEFYVSLFVTRNGMYERTIEFTQRVNFDDSGNIYELSRVFEQETGPSIVDKRAIAHVISNRLQSGSGIPSNQVDRSSPWPLNYINTAFLINTRRARADWTRVTSSASRLLASHIIENNGPTGTDPTHGAIYYCATSARDRLETSNQAFQERRAEVDAGRERRYEIGAHTFYGNP